MKHSINRVSSAVRLGLLSFAMLLVAACSDSGSGNVGGLLSQMPSYCEVAGVGNAELLLQSAGGSIEGAELILPDYLTAELSSADAENINELKAKYAELGINPEAMGIALPSIEKEDDIVFLLTIEDEEKFKAFIVKEGFVLESEEEDLTYYLDETSNTLFAIKGSTVMVKQCRGEVFDHKLFIKKFLHDAEVESVGETERGKYAAEGNLGGMVLKYPEEIREELERANMSEDVVKIYDGYIVMKANLNGNTGEILCAMFDNEGERIDLGAFGKFFGGGSTIDGDALEYLGRDEVLITAVSLKDVNWDSFYEAMEPQLSRNEMSQMLMAKPYLKKLDGTVAIGMGLESGLQSIVNIQRNNIAALQEVPMTIVAEVKSGEAEDLLGQVKGLLASQGMTFNDIEDGISITIPMTGVKLYVVAKDDVLVVSTHEIEKNSDNPTVKNVDFSKYMAAAAIVLNSNHQLFEDLSIRNNAELVYFADVKNVEGGVRLTVDGDNGGVVGNVAKLLIDLRKKLEGI